MVVSPRPRRPQHHRSLCPPLWYRAFWLYGPSCTATFRFGRRHRPCGPSYTSASGPPTGCQHSAHRTLAAPQHSAPVDPTAHVAFAACQLWAYAVLVAPQPSASASAKLMALVSPVGSQPLSLTAPCKPQPSASTLVSSIRSIRPYVNRNLSLRTSSGALWP